MEEIAEMCVILKMIVWNLAKCQSFLLECLGIGKVFGFSRTFGLWRTEG